MGHDGSVMKTHIGIWWGCFTALASLMAQENSPVIPGTVTLPYETVRALEKNQFVPPPRAALPSLVSSAKYQVDLSTTPATIRSALTVLHFSDAWASTPLLPGTVSLSELEPADAPLWIKDEMLQLISQQKGKQEINFRLTPAKQDSLVTLPCVSATLSFVGIPEGKVLECSIDDVTRLLTKNGELGIPAQGANISWQIIAPPKMETLPPSQWQWRHEVVAVESDGLLAMTSFSQAETREGDTREAQLILPAGVSRIEATSESLDQQSLQRADDGSQRLLLRWKGERQLNRAVLVRYQKRVSSLQSTWMLEAPRSQSEKADVAQFYLADQPQRKFSATGLTGPFAPQSLSIAMQQPLQGNAYFVIDAPAGQVSLGQAIMPVASTADAVITKARWDSRIELDGASLTTGQLDVQYRNGARMPLRLPEKAVLLSCSADDQDIVPIIAAPGVLEIALPRHTTAMGGTKLVISYTERVEKFAPLEGQLSLKLPGTSYFIHGMQWQVTLPADYSAEIAGNVTRPATMTSAAHQILLEKNLCRDETPQAEIFYNRQNKTNR
jgi:hypothetical protein